MAANVLGPKTHSSTEQLLVMSYVPRDGDRNDEWTHKIKTVLRPKTYQDVIRAARTSFPEILYSNKIVVESNEFKWCNYHSRVIEADEWERPEVQKYVSRVMVTELEDTNDDFAVPNPDAVVEVSITNPADTRPGHAKSKGLSLLNRKFARSTTILTIKKSIGQTYRVQPTSFSLISNTEYNRFGMSSQYMCTFTDNLCIGEMCTDARIHLMIVWHGDGF